MAGSGVYKLDTGESFPANCFPMRFHPRKEGAGHWVVAHRLQSGRKPSKILKQPVSTGPRGQSVCEALEKRTGNTLNRQMLMSLHCVERPSDLCSVDISDRNLDSVTQEGLEDFDSVAYINGSDNALPLEGFSRFPGLVELELSLNGVCTVKVTAADFPTLEVLDLSYNSLSSDGILSIGLLPRLKVLFLTGNNLQTLPLDLTGSDPPDGHVASESSRLFPSLEVLMLEDNKLSSGVFGSLSYLKRLRHLNLEGNLISEVPYLPSRISAIQRKNCTLETDLESAHLKEPEHFCPPFPELQYLNLAKNKILKEESLLAVVILPLLSELVIHSNPLTTQSSGDPPMLTWILQETLGIKIRRKESNDIKDGKPNLVKPKRKVKTKIPKVLKVSSTDTGTKPENSPAASVWDWPEIRFPSFSHSQTEELETENLDSVSSAFHEQKENTEISNESQDNQEGFFVTEVNNWLEPEYRDETEHFEENNTKQYSKKFLGFEALLDESLNIDTPESVGIQQTVKALENTLKNLLVYRDSKANLDRLQKPYKKQPKRTKNSLPLKRQKTKEETLNELLREMKERKSITEVPLEKVLRVKGVNRKEYEEVLRLLEDMKSKYKRIYMKSREETALSESS